MEAQDAAPNRWVALDSDLYLHGLLNLSMENVLV